jgi:hypothetical protein
MSHCRAVVSSLSSTDFNRNWARRRGQSGGGGCGLIVQGRAMRGRSGGRGLIVQARVRDEKREQARG